MYKSGNVSVEDFYVGSTAYYESDGVIYKGKVAESFYGDITSKENYEIYERVVDEIENYGYDLTEEFVLDDGLYFVAINLDKEVEEEKYCGPFFVKTQVGYRLAWMCRECAFGDEKGCCLSPCTYLAAVAESEADG